MASPLNDFNSLAASWDTADRIARAEAVAKGISRMVPLSADFTGFEYGCGTGLLSFCFQPYLSEIMLADISPGMLEIVKAKIAAASIGNMFPAELDLASRNPLNKKFNIIYTMMTLHHIEDTRGILQAFAAMTSPGGFVCISDLDTEDGTFHGSDFTGHNGFCRDTLGSMTAESGYTDIHFMTVFTITRTYPDGRKKDFPLFLMTAKKE